ncbi:transposase, partial [Pseudomonas cichorii]|nr:transposase [Pseudomonas cichorii]
MSKYTESFKLTAITAYLRGPDGLRTVARRFNIDVSLLRRWVAHYQARSSLKPRSTGRRYSVAFKRQVVDYRREHQLSQRQAAA